MDDDLDTDYRKAGFMADLGFGDSPALVVVDFLVAYLDKESPFYAGVESTLESAIRVRDAARAAGIPVIFTRVVFTPGGVDGGLFYRKVPSLYLLDEGSPLNELPVELSPDPGDLVIKKQYASAFFGTTLASTLNSLGVDTVIITGLTTSGCIRATAVDALQHGFVPIVVREAVGDRDDRVHDANMFDLRAKYADIVSEAAVVEHLENRPR